ncbi:TetR/AcrR family transcriptional regulator [Rhizobium sp. BK251]|uniref:TetR/AcrR family transcriptional regulator n=1 Tax=Rhizobium sp. BK251 TaxID=2512125 RepID=UPI00104E793D|nr:TetR/AcrR family transcriptional regulator [Rhizobium sp. BK251]
MPRITEERRAARRLEILEAAWRCFHRQGLHLTTMDDIIRECGLSAGAVYGYFKNKDELILEAVVTSLSALGVALAPVFESEPAPPPAQLIENILAVVDRFSARSGYDLKRIALLGWAESQRSAAVLEAMHGHYLGFLARFETLAERWRSQGVINAAADGSAFAKTLLSLVMGYVAQSAILGELKAETIRKGLDGLLKAQ